MKVKVGDCFQRNGEICIVTNASLNDGFCDADWATETYKTGSFRIADHQPLDTLHLPIGNDAKKYGGAWFDRILDVVEGQDQKKEEYREIEGTNHTFRNCPLIWGVSAECAMDVFDSAKYGGEISFAGWMNEQNRKPYKVLHLTNGYGHDKPQLWVHIESISIGRGNPEWGAPVDRDVFIIRLGDVFHTKNLK